MNHLRCSAESEVPTEILYHEIFFPKLNVFCLPEEYFRSCVPLQRRRVIIRRFLPLKLLKRVCPLVHPTPMSLWMEKPTRILQT